MFIIYYTPLRNKSGCHRSRVPLAAPVARNVANCAMRLPVRCTSGIRTNLIYSRRHSGQRGKLIIATAPRRCSRKPSTCLEESWIVIALWSKGFRRNIYKTLTLAGCTVLFINFLTYSFGQKYYRYLYLFIYLEFFYTYLQYYCIHKKLHQVP